MEEKERRMEDRRHEMEESRFRSDEDDEEFVERETEETKGEETPDDCLRLLREKIPKERKRTFVRTQKSRQRRRQIQVRS